eukprot:GHVL01007997.1.p1 GENE.GHVL01007997.1~~GHVL01007997.1.p1  ORF type:complete len:114 (-),score=21.78 GHVL01007997.1:230-571(-)
MEDPSWKKTLMFTVWMIPLVLLKRFFEFARWTWRYRINNMTLTPNDRNTRIRMKMQLSHDLWKRIPEDELKEFIDQELWEDDKFKLWKDEQQEKCMKLNKKKQLKTLKQQDSY